MSQILLEVILNVMIFSKAERSVGVVLSKMLFSGVETVKIYLLCKRYGIKRWTSIFFTNLLNQIKSWVRKTDSVFMSYPRSNFCGYDNFLNRALTNLVEMFDTFISRYKLLVVLNQCSTNFWWLFEEFRDILYGELFQMKKIFV